MNRVSAIKIIGSIGLVISMLLNGCTTNSITDNNVSGNDLTATEVIRLMGNGINLGNTLEAYNHKSYVELGVDPTSFETLWGQPVTTREMIDDMKAMGFDTLRIPVDDIYFSGIGLQDKGNRSREISFLRCMPNVSSSRKTRKAWKR